MQEMAPKLSIFSFMGYLVDMSSLRIYGQFGALKFNYIMDVDGENLKKIHVVLRARQLRISPVPMRRPRTPGAHSWAPSNKNADTGSHMLQEFRLDQTVCPVLSIPPVRCVHLSGLFLPMAYPSQQGLHGRTAAAHLARGVRLMREWPWRTLSPPAPSHLPRLIRLDFRRLTSNRPTRHRHSLLPDTERAFPWKSP